MVPSNAALPDDRAKREKGSWADNATRIVLSFEHSTCCRLAVARGARGGRREPPVVFSQSVPTKSKMARTTIN
jgi:hypothetical protein